jgi:hypothetical protein
VCDPFDPENPHRGDYGDCEYWCYQNARSYDDEKLLAYYSGECSEDWLFVYIGVDDDGCIVPYKDYYKQRMEWSIGNYDRTTDTSCAASMICAGPADPGMGRRLARLASGIRAAYVLPVPSWLAEKPPMAAKYMPEGEFVTQGELGSGKGVEQKSFSPYAFGESRDLAWYHYSDEGELLAAGEPGDDWWMLFFPDYMEQLGLEDDEEPQYYENGGIIRVYDPDSYKLTKSFKYDGTELEEPHGSIDELDRRMFATLKAAEIPLIYEAQKTVEPREPQPPVARMGPGIGGRGGSIEIDRTPPEDMDLSKPLASRHPMFTPGTEWALEWIEAKALDAPGNPYSEFYGEWDYWLMENHERLCEEENWNAEGGSTGRVPAYVMRDISGNDQSYQRFTIEVDEEGYVIPTVYLSSIWLGVRGDNAVAGKLGTAPRYMRPYSMSSYGLMDPTMNEGYRRAVHLVKAEFLPMIPAWLAATPLRQVMFLPDGEFVGAGPLGSSDATIVDAGVQGFSRYGTWINRHSKGPWYRYSSDGEFLGQTTDEQEYWFELYFTDFQKVRESFGNDVNIGSGADMVDFVLPSEDQPFRGERASYTYRGEPCEDHVQSYWTISTTLGSSGERIATNSGEVVTEAGPLCFEWLDGKYLPEMRDRQLELAAQRAEN